MSFLAENIFEGNAALIIGHTVIHGVKFHISHRIKSDMYMAKRFYSFTFMWLKFTIPAAFDIIFAASFTQ